MITPDIISKKVVKILEKTTKPYRERLNKNVHVLDFSYSALKLSDPKLEPVDYQDLLRLVSQEYRPSNSIKKSLEIINDKSTINGYTAFVQDPAFGTFIVSKSYSALQTKLAGILKKVKHTSVLTSTDARGVIQANIGHISSNYVDAARSPLELMLRDAASVQGLTPVATNSLMQKVFELENAHAFEASYEYQRPDFNIAKFNKILGKSTVYVTLHGRGLNNDLSQEEKKISDAVKAYVESPEFTEHLLYSKGSPSLVEDIENGIVDTLLGKTSKTSRHSKKAPTKASSSIKGTGKLISYNLPKLRNINTGKFTSLAALQNLLNTALYEQIRRNMGTGSSRNILNYRSGRFASSVTVERLSQSKEGMITAFYNYMKYPYQTFEPGYKQGSPKTRDPKLLIAKSIREIAATQVSNRMRSVLV